MRIDRYLHCIRLVKSRSRAQAIVEEGHVRIDGRRVVKASEAVKVGSVIALPLHERVRVLRVLALPKRRGPASEAREAYEEIQAKVCFKSNESSILFSHHSEPFAELARSEDSR